MLQNVNPNGKYVIRRAPPGEGRGRGEAGAPGLRLGGRALGKASVSCAREWGGGGCMFVRLPWLSNPRASSGGLQGPPPFVVGLPPPWRPPGSLLELPLLGAGRVASGVGGGTGAAGKDFSGLCPEPGVGGGLDLLCFSPPGLKLGVYSAMHRPRPICEPPKKHSPKSQASLFSLSRVFVTVPIAASRNHPGPKLWRGFVASHNSLTKGLCCVNKCGVTGGGGAPQKAFPRAGLVSAQRLPG